MASAFRRPVEVRAYAHRIELRHDGRGVGNIGAPSAAARPSNDPWHYVSVLARKPGAAIHERMEETETGGLKLNAAGVWWLSRRSRMAVARTSSPASSSVHGDRG